jgi:hypothetical protein
MTPATLNKYGMTMADFHGMLDLQCGVCPICHRAPSTGRWCVDHKHVNGWRRMKPEKRRLYVRGIVCWFCNRWYLAKGITRAKALAIAAYLEDFE